MKTAAIVIVTAFVLAALYLGAQLALRAWRNRMNLRAIITGLMTAAYAVSPVDLVPDVLFGIGWLDDLIVIVMAFLYIRRLLNSEAAVQKPVAQQAPGPRPSRASQATIEVVPESSKR